MGELKITCSQLDSDSLAFGDVDGRLVVGVGVDGCCEDIFIMEEDEEKLRVLLNERKEIKG
ncbi:MAG: hypothetical protein GY738_11890 [Pseudoalteromonas sp.]|nr:hypothetical protein [Pseudoalteromonas sp.]